jgi:hypothetical protein
MARGIFLNMASSVGLGIVEMLMQLATADIFQLSMPVSQWKNHVVDEVYRCEAFVLWQ